MSSSPAGAVINGGRAGRQTMAGVRKRAPNACTRCRQQKIRCSGAAPCDQCSRRRLVCHFNADDTKILVTRGFLTRLERQAATSLPSAPTETSQFRAWGEPYERLAQTDSDERHSYRARTPTDALHSGEDSQSESGGQTPGDDTNISHRNLTNPLVSHIPKYTTDSKGKPEHLGTSSNWSFGRRILSAAHEKVFAGPLPRENLLYEGRTYEIGWDGRRTTTEHENPTALPTADYALFLINAVSFHCGQLFHLFNDQDFMQKFSEFHDPNADREDEKFVLWYIHYLLILALGKAFVVRVGQGRKPPGANLFSQAMKLIPDATYLYTDALQSVELLCCAALYLQCIDKRNAAYTLIGQAMRMAVIEGWYTDIPVGHHTAAETERSREVWWTVYIMDCQMSSLIGAPLTMAEHDISARLPSFPGHPLKSQALHIHVNLAKLTTLILRTVYGEDGRWDDRFLSSIKTALTGLANMNDERHECFALDLKSPSAGISRLSAHLHLLHHSCIILTTRPLLYSFWKKRIESTATIRISARGGVRSLLQVCVASAQDSMKILAALQAQSLLESFIPFDLESAWSSALVLLITRVVDPTLLQQQGPWMHTAYSVMDEMASRGNLIAGFRRNELMQLEATLAKLPNVTPSSNEPTSPTNSTTHHSSNTVQRRESQFSVLPPHEQMPNEPFPDWEVDELSGEQLTAIADSLDLADLDWANMASVVLAGDPDYSGP
ncbi:Hypothetical protein R9X50_00647700 [Acrodontium crateriforme]|uniref:Zn(2)-C6 fungal-type domain-containing protein n=1 Tax=Acrodontium crateriforme TaxID=150365 RepID=A0AAQ3M980_9PEZI|nr:Hypothetical protein R9X50_00647700 [Acrodontium crateriforme]